MVNATARSVSLLRRQASATTPTFLRSYTIVGKINTDQMDQAMTLTVLEPLVMPALTLTATAASGEKLSTVVSMYGIASVRGPLLGGAFTDKVTSSGVGSAAAIAIIFSLTPPSAAQPIKANLLEMLLQLEPVGVVLCMGFIV
ncbi:hypothetical protein GGR54DRAFT_634578 [Hypoxylon sp. NC1633]|nr:hypothetical protein GGR54DRAFT_634578 [Hypoxylon sp. NC1633]